MLDAESGAWAGVPREVPRDPWSHVSRAGPISCETKEIGLSQPATCKHAREPVTGDPLREVDVPNEQKSYRIDKYYEPSFPVRLHEDVAQLEPACRQIVEEA